MATDGPRNWQIPTSSADLVALGETAIENIWLCQDASGNLVRAVGTIDLTASGTPVYQQSVTGWTRKAIGASDAVDSTFRRGSGVITPATTSVAWVGIFQFPTAPSAARVFLTSPVTNATGINLQLLPTGRLRLSIANVTVDGSFDYVTDGLAHWIILAFNRTLGQIQVITDVENFFGTYTGSITDSSKGLGRDGSGTTPPAYRCLWLAAAVGNTSAERDWNTFLGRMGVTLVPPLGHWEPRRRGSIVRAIPPLPRIQSIFRPVAPPPVPFVDSVTSGLPGRIVFVAPGTFFPVISDGIVTPTGITTAEAVGSPLVNVTLAPAGIASAETIGLASVSPTVAPTGIASAEAVGSPSVNVALSPAGIASAEAIGIASISPAVLVPGIASAEAFGSVHVAVVYAAVREYLAQAVSRDYVAGASSR